MRMAATYHFNTGSVYEEIEGPSKQTIIFWLRRFLVLPLSFLACLISVSWITWKVFFICVKVEFVHGSLFFSLADRVSTGALFATFGSAVVSVCSLVANQTLTRAYENRDTLMTEICADGFGDTQWTRWHFVPRASTISISKNKHYIRLRNASISFHTKTVNTTFFIPTTEQDFKELPLLRSWLQLKFRRKQYLRDLFEFGENEVTEYMIWDCMTDIYKSALLFRFNSLCIGIGSLVVGLSILFVFLYPMLFEQFIGVVIG